MFEYYVYSISPGQAAAHGGHAKLSGGRAVLLNNHVSYTHATTRTASYWWERSLEKVAESDKASKHHKTLAVIGKLSAQAHKALERYESLNTAALHSHVHLLKVSVAKQEGQSDGHRGRPKCAPCGGGSGNRRLWWGCAVKGKW